MIDAKRPIGVMDSGIGGLTVVRELQRILPGEDIIYFGDSANCPYGNKSSDRIFELSCNMLRFLGENGAKCTAIACNTISTMVERLRPCFDYKIVGIVECAADYVVREGLDKVGLIATEFTVASGNYDALIHKGNPDCRVVGKGSPLLAALVDRGDFNRHDINLEITTQVDNILAREKVENLILGCTHYPMLAAAIRKVVGPEVHIVDSAATTAEVVKRRLADKGLAHPQAGRTGRIRFFITDDPQRFTRTGSLFLNMTITDSDVRLVDLENVPLPDAAETPTQRKSS